MSSMALIGVSPCSEPGADLERERGGRGAALQAGTAGGAGGGGPPECGLDV